MNKSLILWVLLILCFSIGYAQVKTISKYYPVYENKTAIIDVYRTITEDVPYSCFDITKSLTENSTCYKKTEVQVLDKKITMVISSKVIAFTDGVKVIEGYINEDKGVISKWGYDITGRNFKENPRCVQYEIDKGFCNEIN